MTRLNLARFTPKVQPSPPGSSSSSAAGPEPQCAGACHHTRADSSRDIRRPGSSPSLALAFVGKQLLGFESKSRWLGSDVLLRGSRDQSQIVRSQPIRALRASPSSTRSGATCGSQHLQIGGSGGPRPRVSP